MKKIIAILSLFFVFFAGTIFANATDRQTFSTAQASDVNNSTVNLAYWTGRGVYTRYTNYLPRTPTYYHPYRHRYYYGYRYRYHRYYRHHYWHRRYGIYY